MAPDSTTGICKALQDLEHEEFFFWAECKALRFGECHGPCIIEFYNPYGGYTVASYSKGGGLHVMKDPKCAGLI